MQMKLVLVAMLIIILPLAMVPVFAQSAYTQPSTLPAPPQSQPAQSPLDQTAQQVQGAKSIMDNIIDGLHSIINFLTGSANIQSNSNPIGLSSNKIQGVTDSGFKVGKDIANTGWDFNYLIQSLLNLTPYQIPFIVIVAISAIITLIILVKYGKGLLKRGLIIIGVIFIGIIILLALGIHNAVVT
jgi:hypothetical protein